VEIYCPCNSAVFCVHVSASLRKPHLLRHTALPHSSATTEHLMLHVCLFLTIFLLMSIYTFFSFFTKIIMCASCENMWRFSRQMKKTRNGVAHAQSMCTFHADKWCGRQLFLPFWTFSSALLHVVPSWPGLQQLTNNNCYYLLSVYWSCVYSFMCPLSWILTKILRYKFYYIPTLQKVKLRHSGYITCPS
jgi:hypothetical protein